MTPEREAALRELARRIGHRFQDPGHLDRALTHTSFTHESHPDAPHNEALEFLGDAVLGFLVADLLHRADPDGDEGGKTKARAHLVSSSSLAPRAAALGLPALIHLGRGEEKSGGRDKAKIWADAFEAVIAALYLDGGLRPARAFVARQFGPEAAQASTLSTRDHKSALQELLQGRGGAPPRYELAQEEGPSHRRRFVVQCVVAGVVMGEGTGHSKKEAQQEAARVALGALSPES